MATQNGAQLKEHRSNSMAMFLRENIDSGEFPCLQWFDVEKSIASISWTHGGRNEMPLFEKWRIFKNGGTVSNTKPSTMKHNFDMAIKNGSGVRYLDLEKLESMGLSGIKNMKYIEFCSTGTSIKQEVQYPDSQMMGSVLSTSQNAYTPDSGLGSVPASVEAFSPECSQQSQPQIQPQNEARGQPLAHPTGHPPSKSQPSHYDILETAIQLVTLTPSLTQPEPVVCRRAEAPILYVELEHEQRQYTGAPDPNFRNGAVETESWVHTLTYPDPPDLTTYDPGSITSSNERFLERLARPMSANTASKNPSEESLSSGLMSLSLGSDKSWKTGSVERTAEQLNGTVIDNRVLLEQLNKSRRLRDCDLPENIGDRGKEFVVLVRCEGRIECAQVVETGCRMVRERKSSRGPDGVRRIPLCRRDHETLEPITRGVLEKCDGGFLLQCDEEGNIFATRETKCRVYWRNVFNDVTAPENIRRKETITIFDFKMYCEALQRQMNLNELPEVVLDIGNGNGIAYAKLLVTVMSRKAHDVYNYTKKYQPAARLEEEVMSVSDGGASSSAMSCE